MRLVDYIPEVIHAVSEAGEINQTDLTEAVWGTSGRGNSSLTKVLFPEMVCKGLLTVRKAGRSYLYTVTEKGKEKAKAMCVARGFEPLT